jgi:ABC-2 type transport system permease protein
MLGMFERTGAVAGRVLAQLRHDKRLILLSILFPFMIIYFIKILIDALANPFFDPSVYIVPYGAFIVHFITFILTAIVLVRERTAGTLARMFISGYTQTAIISGYLLAYSLLTSVQSLFVLVELNLLFELKYDPVQFGSIYLVMWLLAIISLALGILVSNFARNEGQVFPFIPLILISFIISGILIPVDQLPAWSQAISYLTPLYYGNNILQILIDGGALGDQWGNLVSLLIYGLAVMFIGMLTIRESD